MADIAIPRMTKPWKVVAVALAVFGFVNGYVGAAGAPFCGSMGQCLQVVADAGPPWFYPAALIPGAIAAAFGAAVVYLLFLPVYGARRILHRPPAARLGQDPPASRASQEPPTARRLQAEPPAERPSPEPPAAERRTEPPAVHVGGRRWSQPTPLSIATGAALAWAILSVGPATLAGDLGALMVMPQDSVTAPSCAPWQVEYGSRCEAPGTYHGPNSAAVALGTTDRRCQIGIMEPDGMCHERSGGTMEPLMYDVVRGGQAGLLAFLAVGAALLLWPRLRAAR